MKDRLPSEWTAAIVLGAAMALSFALLAGFFGDAVPLFDTASHFRAHFALLLVLVAVLLARCGLWAAGLASLVVAAFGLYSVYPYLAPRPAIVPPQGVSHYTLLQMNLRYDAPDKAAALRLVGRLSPDLVTLEEVTPAWRESFSAVESRYPFHFYCSSLREGTVAILSRRPFDPDDPGYCNTIEGFAARTVDLNGVKIVIGAEHLRWPWPGRQWRQISSLAPVLARLEHPLLIAGDFNGAPWSAAVRSYAAISGTHIMRGIGPSWIQQLLPPALARYFGLPIDNVLASYGVSVLNVQRAEATSSDHLPVLVTFSLPFSRPVEPPVQSAQAVGPTASRKDR